MPMTVERDVKRDQVWGRINLIGPSGSGKSRGAFEIGSRLFAGTLPIVLINTEPNRGKLYADRFKLEALIELTGSYHPERFIEAIQAAEDIAPGGILILDSATHEWYGTDGVTQQASRLSDWAKARPLHQSFVDRLSIAQMHVIVCCRAKMKYDQSEVELPGGGKRQTVTVLGVGPMQDGDFQYEFSLVGMFDQKSHEVEWSGHIDSLIDTTSNLVTDADEVAEAITGWLSEGEAPAPIEAATDEQIAALTASLAAEGFKPEVIEEKFTVARRANRGKLHPDYVASNLEKSVERLAAKAGGKQDGKAEEAAAGAQAPAEGVQEPEAAPATA